MKYPATEIKTNIFEIPASYRSDMRVPARLVVDRAMLAQCEQDRSIEQIINVTTLPGIQRFAMAMADMHEGYGFPIGGVAATAIDEGGVISPGGIGYDINCGVRMLASDLEESDVLSLRESLVYNFARRIPVGAGKGGKWVLKTPELDRVLKHGAGYLLKQGIGEQSDLLRCEENGCFKDADPNEVSERAKVRGHDQLGTLGSGNHFVEIQAVDEVFHEDLASTFGLFKTQICVLIHTGSRGLGHQVCTDHVRQMQGAMARYGISLPDRQLACAPFLSVEGQAYYKAMKASANFAWANRHLIAHRVREAFQEVFGASGQLRLVYDVAHNIGKIETYVIDSQKKQLLVHRKGATRAFGPGRIELPLEYRFVGQPVFVPGSMGTASYVLCGTRFAEEEGFASTCHGAGRTMSRGEAKRRVSEAGLRKELEEYGVSVYCPSRAGLVEEAPVAYKDIDQVVNVMADAGFLIKVARMRPLGVIKG